jgi:hypothetical protein
VCTSPQDCAGLLRLQNRGAQGATAAKMGKRTRTYGKTRFRIKAGQTKTVKVPLTKAGKRLMRKRKRRKRLPEREAHIQACRKQAHHLAGLSRAGSPRAA